MSNPFVPYGIFVKDITHGSVIIGWDVDNTVEFRPGTYYKVFKGAISGGPYSFFSNANINYISIPKDFAPFYVTVSCVVPGMGESAQSAEFLCTIERGVLDTEDNTTIAITPDGRPVKLRATATGELIISGGSVNANISGFSTEAAQQQHIAENHADFLSVLGAIGAFQSANHNDIALLTTQVSSFRTENGANLGLVNSNLTLINGTVSAFALQNNNNLSAIKTSIDNFKVEAHNDSLALKNALQADVAAFKLESHNDSVALKASVDSLHVDLTADNAAMNALVTSVDNKMDTLIEASFANLMRQDVTLNNVTPAGVIFSLPWMQKSIIHQITVLKESGNATQWTIEVINKASPFQERNIILRDYSYNSYDPNRYDILRTVPYINLNSVDLVWLRLTPDAGTSNTFYVAVSGEKAK